ncbi:CHAT domain-containing tetratricopeptide repeat protein [Calothrix sp. PCC 7507]|uniref:CHAT domain-containing tetratricopeptide repeat protein n=1 Tax=Calothrix sp. PCC 7507 TaxID=99598 RepID=UPI00029F34ED|nr:CHAT domain-containing tetratricopeptide repeat protein [Calothrix sp. PCC 7507]AFY33799.1 Tetratricopeptide TPR_1 repeat-containing protein [Calothrix sp. PCC 7507]
MTQRQADTKIPQPNLQICTHSSLALVVSILLSAPVLASPSQHTLQTAQLPQTTSSNANQAAAEKAHLQGVELYEQGTAESIAQALEKWQEALKLWRLAGDKAGEAITLTYMGLLNNVSGNKQQALALYNQALPLWRIVADKEGEATTLSNIGKVYSDLGDKQQALAFYNQALPLRRAAGDKTGEALTLNNIGGVYSESGDKQQALALYNQALALRRLAGDKAGEANSLNNIGGIHDELGDKQKALEFYHQALPLRRAVGDKAGVATTLNNIGKVHDDLGDKQKALEFYHQALSLRREAGNKAGVAVVLNNIGRVYDELGDKQKALEFYNQALPLRQAVGNKTGEAATLNNIGKIYNDLADTKKALEFYNQALSLTRVVGNKANEAVTLSNLGAVYSDLGDKQKALEFYNQALPLRQAVGDKAGEATSINNIGSIYEDLGDKQKALTLYNQALPLWRMVGNKAGEAATLSNIAKLEGNLGNLKQAITQIEAAIAIIEDLRTKVASPELRTSYFASQQNVYKYYIELLMQLHKQQPSSGYDAQALQVSERSRARSLLELLTESHADIRQGVEPKLLAEERTIQQKLDALEKRRIEFNGKYSEAQMQALESETEALLEKYQEVQTQIRATSPRYAALTQPKPLTLAEIQQQVLDENTMLLQYSLGEKRSYLWAVTKTSISSYELPKRADIETVAQQFYLKLKDPRYRINTKGTAITNAAIAKLSEILLQPVATQLGNKRLLVVSDGALQYVPFAALLSPPNKEDKDLVPLLVKHEIVSLPSATTLAVLRKELKGRKTAPKKLAVLADPIFSYDDERLKKIIARRSSPSTNKGDVNSIALARAARDTSVSFDRLPFTREEAQGILALVPKSMQLRAFDFAASRAFITSTELQQFQIVHFATHGILNSTHPELSGIVLSLFDHQGQPQNGFLRLHDVFNLNLPAELVVLSACETGLGEEVKGEGLVGLTRGFMYAGSPRVLVSLWSVSDEGTSALMQKFYHKMLKEGLPAAAALRSAQIEMWQNQSFAAPFYWAAFTLQGEWK